MYKTKRKIYPDDLEHAIQSVNSRHDFEISMLLCDLLCEVGLLIRTSDGDYAVPAEVMVKSSFRFHCNREFVFLDSKEKDSEK